MTQYAIEVTDLGKRYKIGELEERERRDFRTVITDAVTNPLRRARALLGGEAYGALGANEVIWALRDINFNVEQGEVVGIIGKNGAGKSTLLKILSRITKPTEGRLRLRGRVGSLLEVGTGFHQDLTGRENVYLNGAILGMSREEIARKFDEIVAFAGVEKFIDTPVKFYSSGMGLRLGFAVAAHLEPDILVVDEVLAVGDAEFQKKCLGRMNDVANEGRTVLFVSHNMGAVRNLCTRAVLLESGRITFEGGTEQTIDYYLSNVASSNEQQGAEIVWQPDGVAKPDVTAFRLHRVRILSHEGMLNDMLDPQKPFHIEIEYDIHEEVVGARLGFLLRNHLGDIVFDSYDVDNVNLSETRTPGRYISRATVPANLLRSGQYMLDINAGIPGVQSFLRLEGVTRIYIAQVGTMAERDRGKRQGVIQPLLDWETVSVEESLLHDC